LPPVHVTAGAFETIHVKVDDGTEALRTISVVPLLHIEGVLLTVDAADGIGLILIV
jgi:hypothetical protein